MKADIHPQYGEIQVHCSGCNRDFTVSSTLEQKLTVEICSNCHPFYTGEQKIISTARQVEKFHRRYGSN